MSFNFDATTVTPDAGYTILPAGDYAGILESSEWVATNDTKDSMTPVYYIKCCFAVTVGEHMGRKLYHNFNLYSTSEKAVDIAKGQLSALCHATGIMQPSGQCLEMLHNAPLTLSVVIEGPKDGYPEKNRVVSFKSINEFQPPAGGMPGQQPPATKSPWG